MSKPLATASIELQRLDLEPVKLKLTHKEEGGDWTREQADRVGVWYKRFLFLVAKYPEKVIVPTRMIDEMWHAHILDTIKYEKDCDRIFGHFLHHFPYFGMRGESDAQELRRCFEETKKLFVQDFLEDLSASPMTCYPMTCHNK